MHHRLEVRPLGSNPSRSRHRSPLPLSHTIVRLVIPMILQPSVRRPMIGIRRVLGLVALAGCAPAVALHEPAFVPLNWQAAAELGPAIDGALGAVAGLTDSVFAVATVDDSRGRRQRPAGAHRPRYRLAPRVLRYRTRGRVRQAGGSLAGNCIRANGCLGNHTRRVISVARMPGGCGPGNGAVSARRARRSFWYCRGHGRFIRHGVARRLSSVTRRVSFRAAGTWASRGLRFAACRLPSLALDKR